MKGTLAESIDAVSAATRAGGDVLGTAADAARRLTGARAALVVVVDGARHEARVSAEAGDAAALAKSLEELSVFGRTAQASLAVGEGAGGIMAVLEPEDGDDLQAFAAHAGLALEHTMLRREAMSTRSIYRTLVEQLPAVTYYRALDAPGVASYASPQVESLLGFTTLEMLQDADLWRKRVHPDDILRVLSEQAHGAPDRGDGPIRAEYRMIHKDGRTVWVENYAHVVRDEGGQPRFVLGLIFDVTERKRLEEQLRHAQKMEAIGKLAGGIAHDFNNLLSVVLSYAQSLAAELPADDPKRQEAREILRAGDRAKALTQQLLAFSQRQMLAPKVLDLAQAVNNLKTFFLRLLGEDVELVLDTGRASRAVKADPTQIEQVLMNLAVNARDAMPRGGRLSMSLDDVDVEAPTPSSSSRLPAGPYVRLRVADSGEGMDEATSARVFEPFFTTKDPSRNSGLGLSTALGIIEQSGGTMTVESAPGRGTTFEVLLPATEDVEPTPRPRPKKVLPRGSETVLVAEDDEQVRHLVRMLLERLGYRVLPCEHGDHALETARQHTTHIDILLSDVIMPRMSGFELARQMVRVRPGIRVLFMSGYNEEAVSRHGAPAGVTILHKPFSVSELATELRRALDAER